MHLLYLESFYSGSHKFFLDHFIKHSQFDIKKLVIKEKSWRLNYEKSAPYFYQLVENIQDYDFILASSLTDVHGLRAFYHQLSKFPKVIMYWHENQFEYPGKTSDYVALKDLYNFLSSDLNVFNSEFHRHDFYKKAKKELKKFKLFDLLNALKKQFEQAEVVYPGFDLEAILPLEEKYRVEKKRNREPVILWNHRWSKDKDYFMFFSMMRYFKKRGYRFKLNIFGEAVLANHKDFEYFKEQMDDFMHCFGFLESKEAYYREVLQSDIVISTAIEENFGISMVESMYMGATPILPNRLSYPELIPEAVKNRVIYKSYDDAIAKIKMIFEHQAYLDLSEHMKQYDIRLSIKKFDDIIKNIHNK